MTNAQETDRDADGSLGYIPLPQEKRANPWRRTLKWTWLGLVGIALIVVIAGTSKPSEYQGDSMLRPLDEGLLAVFVVLLVLAFFVALAHAVVLAVTFAFEQHVMPPASHIRASLPTSE